MPRENGFSALILAGGNSTRMGRDKAFLRIRGVSLIENLIRQIDGLFKEVIICASSPEKYAHLRRRVAVDALPGGGPLMGILSGLRESKSAANFVFSCDIPRIDAGFLLNMMASSATYDLVIPRYGNGHFEPLLGIYMQSVIPVIERQLASGSAKIAELFPRCRTRFVSMDDQKWYRNLNTTDDYVDFLNSDPGCATPAAMLAGAQGVE